MRAAERAVPRIPSLASDAGFSLHRLTPAIPALDTPVRLPLETSSFAGQPSVAVYRVMSEAELGALDAGAALLAGDLGNKGFSLFWQGSVSDQYSAEEHKAGRGEYGRVVRFHFSPALFESLLSAGRWMVVRDGESAGLVGHPGAPDGTIMVHKNLKVDRRIGGQAVFDELNAAGGALPLLQSHLLGYEALPGSNPAFESPGTRLRRHVRSLSSPWRTDAQLEKLAQTPRAESESFRFTVIGDAEPGRFALWRLLFNVPGVFTRLLKDSARRGADFTVQLGDMVSRGTMRNFLEFFKTLAGVGPEKPYLTVIGNHDRRKPHGVSDNQLYRSLFGKTDYFFDHGGTRFVTVDSSAGRLTADQLRWLDAALDTAKRKIVFTHMAPAVIKPWGKGGGDKSWGGFKEGSAEFADLVSRRKVERVYVGHIHGLRFKEFRGVRYVITGGGGSPLFPGGVRNNFHHYLTVEVTPDGIRETVHKADGTSFTVP